MHVTSPLKPCPSFFVGAPPAVAAGVALALGMSSPFVVASIFVVGLLSHRALRRWHLDPKISDVQRRALIAESTALGVVMTDREGRIQWLNEGFTKISGYTLEEVVGQKPGAVLQYDRSQPEEINVIREAVKAGRGFQGEIWNRGKAGNEYLISIEIRPLQGRGGEVVGFVALEMDVTEQRRLESELEVSERQMRDLVEDTNVTVWEYDPSKDVFVYVSPQAEHFGYPIERWYEPGFFARMLHPDDRAATLRCCASATSRGEDHEMVYRAACANGDYVWVRDIVKVALQPDESVVLRGVLVDITQQKESELELARLSEAFRVEAERSELAFEGASLGLWDWHIAEDQLIVNECWANMVGYEVSELSGRTSDWTDRLHPEDQSIAEDALNEHFAGNTPIYEARFRFRHKDGHWLWLRARGKVVERDLNGAPERMVGVQMDQTADVEREEQLKRLRSEADAANRSKSEFLANMSHEIRTPLTAILGYADLLHDDEKDEPQARRVEMLGTIRSAGTHLLTVINDILDLSKIEADRVSIESIETDLPKLIQDVTGLARMQAESKGVSLTIVVDGEIPECLLIDPTRVRQVLVNLLGNAAKFTDLGEIVLRVSCPGKTRLRLEVEDTGPGMEPTAIETLFEPFSQADGTVTRRFGGSGLGLSISSRLAKLMGGAVVLEWSKPDVGSCFSLEVPVKVPPTAAWGRTVEQAVDQEATSMNARQQRRLSGRILLVEDGAVNQRLIAAILKRAGAEVVIAENGQVALDVLDSAEAQGDRIDLVVSDMQMPVMDGYTLAKTLGQRLPAMPVIALTAHAMSEDEGRCLEAGCVAYTTKPIQRDELIELCQRYLDGNGQRRLAS